MRKSMTPVSTLGNLRGSFIASVMGITRPMPSNENTAVLNSVSESLTNATRRTRAYPINRGQSLELKSSTCACPLFAMIAASLPNM